MKAFVSFVTIVVIGVIGVTAWLWGFNILHWFTSQWREGTAFWFFAMLALIALIVAFVTYSRNDEATGLTVFSGFATGGLLIAGILMGVSANYNMLNTYYTESVNVAKSSDAPNYEERAPYEVAVRTSDKNLLNTTGEADVTKSLSDEGENGEWNTLVRTRGPFVGYESIQNLNLPLYGASKNGDVAFCKFDKDNTLRHSGSMPHNNLSRAIYGQVPLNVDFAASDAYGYCNEEGEPIVATPLKAIDGFLFPTWSYYGVALYNGETGDLDILNDVEDIANVPGPVYPMSLAETQRNSLTASEGWWEFAVTQSSGYIAATENSEVQLRREDGEGSDFVTALTPRGSSSSVVAVGYVSAIDVVPGELSEFTMAMLPDEHIRPANSTLIDDIKTRYSYMPDMANDTLGVFEITSWKDGGWVASIGREQSVNYRAYITATGDITLYNRDGKLIAQGVGGEDDEGETDGGLTPTGEISELTDEELTQLGKDVLDELARRAATETK
jgi:hypothetical protein